MALNQEYYWEGERGGDRREPYLMPWMGMAYITLQEQVSFSAPGGVKLHRLMSTCACGVKFEFVIAGKKAEELNRALGEISEHLIKHLVLV